MTMMTHLLVGSSFAIGALSIFGLPQTPVPQEPIAVQIDLSKTHQPMLGFGGTQTYNGDAVLGYGERDRVYRALFSDLKLDFLRLRNFHDYPGQQATFENMLGGNNTLQRKRGETAIWKPKPRPP